MINSTRLSSGDIFKGNSDYICNKARQSVFAMRNKIKSLEIPVIHLYQTIVQPVLVHGSDIWGGHRNRFGRSGQGFQLVPPISITRWTRTSKIMMAGEVGMFPPSVQCQKNVLMYLHRLKSMPAGSVLQSVFTESKRLSHLGYRTWYNTAKVLAQSYDTDIAKVGDLVSSKQAI